MAERHSGDRPPLVLAVVAVHLDERHGVDGQVGRVGCDSVDRVECDAGGLRGADVRKADVGLVVVGVVGDAIRAEHIGPDGIRRNAEHTFSDETSAGVWLTLRQTDLIRGEWNGPDLGRIPFGNFAASWIEEHVLSERTRELYATLLRLHIHPFLGRKELAAIGPETIRKWRKELAEEGQSADAVAKAYRLVRAVMATAVDDGRIKRNPCRIKGADTAARAERPVASVKQVYGLAEAIGPRFRAFILAAAFTGLRWGELIALRRIDVDLDDAKISVHRSIAELSGGRLVVKPPMSTAGTRRSRSRLCSLKSCGLICRST
ncbi:site-specific integrase [Kribbella sp. NPDC003505]|uniref:tyrosine-type recombinase/integrase n=1 Tax=Kribbella sp. NPDC003505 TaxID=3154448 RepID=UPI0033A3ED52